MFVAMLSSLFVLPALAAGPDPFAGLSAAPAPAPAEARSFFTDNFGFKKELMSEFSADRFTTASRQSAGFEVQKKFSSDTATWASVDFQGRLVRRDRWAQAPNDMEGMTHPGWRTEHHNAYADFFGPLGRVNARVGRFYLPFGLNQATDTHGTLLQLSNEADLGYERDWMGGLYGSLNRDFDYGAYYLAGSGYDLKWRGQSGLAAARVSLGNRWRSEMGLEGGVSVMDGERLAGTVIKTERIGVDARITRPGPGGAVTWTSEIGGGRDATDGVFSQLHQLDYLRASRRWGLSAQYRRLWKDMTGPSADASAILEGSWYFSNDAAGSHLEWVKLALEDQTERREGKRSAIVTLQYYRYW